MCLKEYKVAFKVSAAGKEDVQERDLTVKKGTAWLEPETHVALLQFVR